MAGLASEPRQDWGAAGGILSMVGDALTLPSPAREFVQCQTWGLGGEEPKHLLVYSQFSFFFFNLFYFPFLK